MEQDAVPTDGTQADCLRAQFHRHERKAGRVHPHAVKGQFPGHDLRGNGGENLELVHERHPEFFQPFQAYIGIRNVREYLVIGTVHRFQRRTAYLRRPQFPGNGLQHQAVRSRPPCTVRGSSTPPERNTARSCCYRRRHGTFSVSSDGQGRISVFRPGGRPRQDKVPAFSSLRERTRC